MPRRFVGVLLLLIGIAPLAHGGCWTEIDPGAFAQGCPIIVAGTIEKVVEAKRGGERDDDIASIRIDKLHRNELKDLGLRAGDLIPVRMISKNNRQRTSTDINYPVNTKAVWLIVLTSKGEFRIDIHPVQKQKEMPKFREVQRIDKKGEDNSANPAGSKTTAEWIDGQKKREAQRAKELAAYRAQQQAIRDLAKLFAEPDGLNDTTWKRYQEAEPDLRRSMFQLGDHEQPMSAVRFAEVVRAALVHEKDANIRTHAVCRLGYSRDPGDAGVAALKEGMRDPSADVRMFACQSVKQRRYEQLTPQVKALQNDPSPQVREMATDTLEFWKKAPGK